MRTLTTWPPSNGRTGWLCPSCLPLIKQVLFSVSYGPILHERPNPMAVSADDIALGDLVSQSLPGNIRTRSALEFVDELPGLLAPRGEGYLNLSDSTPAVSRVPDRVVFSPASLALRIEPLAFLSKGGEAAAPITLSTTLHFRILSAWSETCLGGRNRTCCFLLPREDVCQ